MVDSVYIGHKSLAVEPTIHMITFTSEGELSMVETSNTPVKVEILQHENGSQEHYTLHPQIGSVTSINGTTVCKSKTSQLCHHNRVALPESGSQSNPNSENCAGSKTEGVQRIMLKGREIVTVPEVYLAIQRIWKSQGSIQRLMPKLGIQVMRFSPQELTGMKQRGAISLTVKCCSYILKSDFEIIAEKYDDTHGTRHTENLLFLPLVNLDNPESTQGIPTKVQSPTSSRTNCHKSPTGFKMQTFLLDTGKKVMCTNELQGLFEAHFQNSEILKHCLVRLGISPGKFTDCMLQELRAWFAGGSDGPKLGFSRSYVMVDDAKRVVSYAANLLNAGKPEITWDEQPKVLNGKEVLGNQANVSHSIEEGDTLPESQDPPTFLSSSSSTTVSKILNSQGIVGTTGKLKNSGVDGETSSSVSISSGHPEVEQFASQSVSSSDCSVHPKVSDIQPSSATNRLEQSLSLQPEVVIRTFLVDGEVVVCIPDVHKVVIYLHSQSVQVGYYMQRLQITPCRFSCAHVKQLKTHNVLSAKATVCTYIRKSDAERLLHIYDDLPSTGSRLQDILWAEPIALGTCKEAAVQEGKESGNEGSPQSPTTIPTFEIDGEAFVSVPDAHRAVQTLNGQSVQLRYYLEEMGIAKYKFSYPQVYQMKTYSVLKRQSTCTFIAKSDAKKLVQVFLNPRNASRLALIEWLPAVRLGSSEIHQVDRGDADGMQSCAKDHSIYSGRRDDDLFAYSGNTGKPQPPSTGHQTVGAEASQGDLDESSAASPDVPLLHVPYSRIDAAQVCEAPTSCCNPGIQQRSVDSLHTVSSAHAGYCLEGMQIQCPSHTTTAPSFAVMSSVSSDSVHLGQNAASASTDQGGYIVGEKRAHTDTKEDQNRAHVKKLREDNEELVKTLHRKETELKLLHDAYQQQIEKERGRRNIAEQELEELKHEVIVDDS